MLRDPFTKWLWDQRRSIIGWSVAIAAVGGMYAAFWPTFDDPEVQKLIDSYPEALMEALNYTDIASAAGYLNATVYGLIVAVLSIVYATTAGTRLIAGDEEAGTLDLVLVHPVSRRRLAWERYGAYAVSIVVITTALLVVILAIAKPFHLTSVPFVNLLAMHAHLILFGCLFGAIAFAVGAATGRRVWAISVPVGVAVFGFAANGVLKQVDGMEWTERLSPFEWLNGSSPLANGVDPWHLALMAGISVVLVLVGVSVFERRDVGV